MVPNSEIIHNKSYGIKENEWRTSLVNFTYRRVTFFENKKIIKRFLVFISNIFTHAIKFIKYSKVIFYLTSFEIIIHKLHAEKNIG